MYAGTVFPLEHTDGVLPPSLPGGGVPVHTPPFGVPAFTHDWNVPISAGVGGTAGAGGIGEVVLVIRASARWATDCPGYCGDGATRSPYESIGGACDPPWHAMHPSSSTFCTSHGKPVSPPVPAAASVSVKPP